MLSLDTRSSINPLVPIGALLVLLYWHTYWQTYETEVFRNCYEWTRKEKLAVSFNHSYRCKILTIWILMHQIRIPLCRCFDTSMIPKFGSQTLIFTYHQHCEGETSNFFSDYISQKWCKSDVDSKKMFKDPLTLKSQTFFIYQQH
jgi:hypothetical protein